MFDPLVQFFQHIASSALTILVLTLQIATTLDWFRRRRWENISVGWLWLIWLLPFGGLFYLMDKDSKMKKLRSMSRQTRQEQQEPQQPYPQRPYQEGYQFERSRQMGVAPATFSYDEPQASYPVVLYPEQPVQQR
jgi:hypothetical protein